MDLDSSLNRLSAAQYGEQHAAHRLEQYKLYVEMADRIGARRQAANTFFLTINTALLAFLGLFASDQRAGDAPVPWVLAVAAAGSLLCYVWYRLVRSYGQLGRGKYRVIHHIEQQLPLAPYLAEWDVLGQGHDPKQYLPLTRVEVTVPWVFLILYLALAVYRIVGTLT